MSHIVEIRTQVRDPAAVQAACGRLGLPAPRHGTAELFSGEATGLIVQFPDWKYPAVCDTNTGQIRYDNYEGHWGDEQQLHRFLQAYTVEKARIEARKKGHSAFEQPLADGSIYVAVHVGGAA